PALREAERLLELRRVVLEKTLRRGRAAPLRTVPRSPRAPGAPAGGRGGRSSAGILGVQLAPDGVADEQLHPPRFDVLDPTLDPPPPGGLDVLGRLVVHALEAPRTEPRALRRRQPQRLLEQLLRRLGHGLIVRSDEAPGQPQRRRRQTVQRSLAKTRSKGWL